MLATATVLQAFCAFVHVLEALAPVCVCGSVKSISVCCCQLSGCATIICINAVHLSVYNESF